MKTAVSNILKTKLYDGRKAIADTATLILTGPMANVVSRTIAKQFPISQLLVSPRIGQADRFVSLPDGLQLQCTDVALLDRLPQEGKAEGLVAWLEQRWWVALACLAITVSGLLAAYFIGLPMAAKHISARMPMEYERVIGEQSLTWIDDRKLFMPSQLDPDTHRLIAEGFARLSHGLPMAAFYRLEFRRSPMIGPNALAFPGGIIVITDEMVQKAESPGEALAVLAHEIGHVERRHAMRHILQDSAVATLVATLAGDASSLSLAVSGLPVMLAQAKYSREFESEADEFAFRLLKQHDISPELFATLMERLTEADQDSDDESAWSFISSHPITAHRIARAREAASQP